MRGRTEPQSREEQLGFDAYYRISRANRIGGGYDSLGTDATAGPFDRTQDKRLFLEYRTRWWTELAARLSTRASAGLRLQWANLGTGPTDYSYWGPTSAGSTSRT